MAAAPWDLPQSVERATPGRRAHLRLVHDADAAGQVAGRRLAAPYLRRRVAVTLLALAIVTVLAMGLGRARPWLAAWLLPGGDGGGPQQLVVVGPGETVWDLALGHAPAGTDHRAWVADVLARNDLDPRSLPAGTTLRVPGS